jgi:hypothetical protein
LAHALACHQVFALKKEVSAARRALQAERERAGLPPDDGYTH